jgi:hypothetical protein
MATFSPVVSGDDGGDWNGANFSNTVTTDPIGDDSTGDYRSFIRFPSVTIPQGATITAASVEFTPLFTDGATTVNVDVYFNNVDNAVAPTSTAELTTAFGSITAAVNWTVPAWTADTPDSTPSLVSILQTVVNRAGWASGNALMVLIRDNSSTTSALRRPKNVDWGVGLPVLTVEFTEGSSPTLSWMPRTHIVRGRNIHVVSSGMTPPEKPE